jgi:hypothetical protein
MNKHGWVVAAAALGCGTGHSAFEDDGNVSAQREAVTLNDLNGRCWRISTVFGAQEVGAGGSTYMQFRYLDANTVTRLADTRSHQRNDTQRWCFSGSVVPAVGGTGGGPGDLALGLLRHRSTSGLYLDTQENAERTGFVREEDGGPQLWTIQHAPTGSKFILYPPGQSVQTNIQLYADTSENDYRVRGRTSGTYWTFAEFP